MALNVSVSQPADPVGSASSFQERFIVIDYLLLLSVCYRDATFTRCYVAAGFCAANTLYANYSCTPDETTAVGGAGPRMGRVIVKAQSVTVALC